MDTKGSIYRENKIGPNMEPSFIPQTMGAEEEDTLSILTEAGLGGRRQTTEGPVPECQQHVLAVQEDGVIDCVEGSG